MNMKRILASFLGLAMLLCFAACGAKQPDAPQATAEPAVINTVVAETEVPATNTEVPDVPAETDAPSDTEEPPAQHSETLVVYFSATGTTKGVAERIAAVTGGDLYEIVPAEPYTDADLNWNDGSSRSTREQNDKSARPAIGSDKLDLTGYKTIFIGFPIWWGEEPRIMDTFAESYDFSGITLIPFCTSGSSGIGRSGPNMEALAGSGAWLEGRRFSGSVSESELREWINGLK